MTEFEREVIFKIAGGKEQCFPLIHQLCQYRRKMEIFAWLLKHKITGEKFIEFNLARKCSMLRVGKDILEKIDGRRQTEVRAGVDLL